MIRPLQFARETHTETSDAIELLGRTFFSAGSTVKIVCFDFSTTFNVVKELAGNKHHGPETYEEASQNRKKSLPLLWLTILWI